MNIFINARFLTQNITGVQRYAIEISKRLRKLCPEMRFIAPKKIMHKDLADDLKVEIIGNLSGHTWEQIELPAYLRSKNNPLLINLANTAPLFYKNKIVTLHDVSFLRNPGWFSRKFYLYYRFLVPRIISNSLKIITVSEFSRKEIINLMNVSEKKIHVVHGAVSEHFINAASGEGTFFGKNGDYILAVSSLDPRKNFKNLILAYTNANLPGIKLLLSGRENKIFSDHELADLIRQNENIILTGHVTDNELAILYKNAKLLVFPSLYEGFGLPPLEAMACGCPVVVSNVASLPEVCGDAACYVDPYSQDAIADGIYKVLSDETLRRDLINKGLERAAMFNWDASANKYLKIIQGALNN